MNDAANDAGEAGLRDRILNALRELKDPDLDKDVVSAGFVKELLLKRYPLGHEVSLTLELTTPACPLRSHFESEARRLVEGVAGVRSLKLTVTGRVQSGRGAKSLPGIAQVIAVGAGKGGVGKSTVALNLALSLLREGARVGFLDADVQGPSAAIQLGLTAMPAVKQGRIQPVTAYGMPCMSFAFFAPVGEATLLRGPQSGKAVEQMLRDVEWPELDYLVVDLPPGTGDVHLALYHAVDVAGAVVVSTPQDLSLADASKGIAMFRKMKIPVLGLVENMSGFVCPHCRGETDIFGSGGAEKEAERLGVPFLGRVPLDVTLVRAGDNGKPVVASQPEHEVAKIFLEMSRRVAHRASVARAQESA